MSQSESSLSMRELYDYALEGLRDIAGRTPLSPEGAEYLDGWIEQTLAATAKGCIPKYPRLTLFQYIKEMSEFERFNLSAATTILHE